MVVDADGQLWVSNADDGVHAFNAALVETAFVSTGSKSFPYGLAFLDGRLYTPLWGLDRNSVVEITGTSVTRTIPVGPNPVNITVFIPN
jgi:hypothetical protein